ncbi:MAG: histidine kinase N-terminal 7TM domain-containing protein [Rhodothermales bacterium]
MESLVFVSLAPVATILMLVVAHFAWRRRAEPGGRALFAFSILEAGWLACDTLALVAPTPEATLRLTQATLLFASLLGTVWLAFVLSYTERFSRAARIAVGALAAWCLFFSGMALTNDAHRLVWATWEAVPDGPFLRLAYTLGPLAWAQTAFMWVAMTVSFGAILVAYAGAGERARTLSWWIVAGALVPMGLNVGFLLGLGPFAKDFTPLALAISSGAFALGLARYQFLDLRPVARAALVDALHEGMLVLDARGRIADVNPAMRSILGEPDALIGCPLHDVDPLLDKAIAEAPTLPFRVGDGADARYFDLRVSPLSGRNGRASGRLVLLHDVSHRREEQAAVGRANAALSEANAELQASNEELDAFAHTVAHDLKNSIHNVLGYAELLRDDGPELPPDAHHALADDLVRQARKMGSVVHELLLLAVVRQTAVEPQPIAMDAVVEEALDRAQHARGDASEVTLPVSWPEASGHAPWVEEIWVNYLTNAAKYGGPTVTLGAEAAASGQARFWVHDDGPGIPPGAQQRLFIPFSRVGTEAVEGHGLGLSIVRRIAERLDGTCGVESAPGEGTRFWFELPCASLCASLSTADAEGDLTRAKAA